MREKFGKIKIWIVEVMEVSDFELYIRRVRILEAETIVQIISVEQKVSSEEEKNK